MKAAIYLGQENVAVRELRYGSLYKGAEHRPPDSCRRRIRT